MTMTGKWKGWEWERLACCHKDQRIWRCQRGDVTFYVTHFFPIDPDEFEYPDRWDCEAEVRWGGTFASKSYCYTAEEAITSLENRITKYREEYEDTLVRLTEALAS